MSFEELKFPRRKNFIKNLNILLDSTPIISPQKAIATRILSKNYSHQNPQQNYATRLKSPNSPIKIPESKNLLSLRALQQRDNKKSRRPTEGSLRHRNTKSAHDARRNPIKILQQKAAQQLVSSRKINTQNSSRVKKNEININDQFQGNIDLIMTTSTQFPTKTLQFQKFKSLQLKRSSEQTFYDYRPKISPAREYLKKGTSINKSILNNIIRMKLSRPFNNEHKGFQNHIDNKQIVNLIKLYKGVESVELAMKQSNKKEKDKNCIEQRQKDPLYIGGWYYDYEEFGQDQGI